MRNYNDKYKYIIRNCPAIYEYGKGLCCNDLKFDEHTICQDCTYCLLKQIVEKCKKEITTYRKTLLPNDGTNTIHFGRQSFAYDILKLLDIEEINSKIKRNECPYGGIDCAWCAEDCE